MSDFIQMHILVSYPPSNLNRDDLGRPKTAIMGGKTRLRISSQSLKRAWRISDQFSEKLDTYIGIRTRKLGDKIQKSLETGITLSDLIKGENEIKRNPLPPESAKKWADKYVAEMKKKEKEAAGEKKNKGNKKQEESEEKKEDDSKEKEEEDTKKIQVMHFAPEEILKIDAVLEKIIQGEKKPVLDVFVDHPKAIDIAMFGRMLAQKPAYNVEAAIQVSHAITVHQVTIEDDYFTAVDDLNRNEEDSGSAHLNEAEFSSGVFYLYLCINKSLLVNNLKGDIELANTALRELVEASCTIPPSGKQNSYASRAYASYILAEKGTKQPRSLAVAFLKALKSDDILSESVRRLKETREQFDLAYGPCAESKCEMDVAAKIGSLENIKKFVAKDGND